MEAVADRVVDAQVERRDQDVLAAEPLAHGREGGCRLFAEAGVTQRPLTAVYDPQADALEFRNLLPDVPAASPMYAELKAFARQRADSRLPDHRRIDPKRAAVKCSNRKGAVSIVISFKKGDREYGVTRAVKLVNEIFCGFLKGPYFDYMVENFGEPAE